MSILGGSNSFDLYRYVKNTYNFTVKTYRVVITKFASKQLKKLPREILEHVLHTILATGGGV